MVHTVGTTQGTIITLENYASFQGQQRTEGSAKGSAEGSAKGTHNKNVIKNDKEEVVGKDGTIVDSVLPPQEERYRKVHDYMHNRTLIYDTVEERYIDG